MKKFILFLMIAATLTLGGCGNPTPTDSGFNYSELPFYEENMENVQYEDNAKTRVQPFWLGNVIYNESATFKQKNGVTKAELLYKPLKILSVYDWTLKVKYEEGIDYTLSKDGYLELTENSGIPTFNDDWAYGKNMPDGYEKIDDLGVVGNKYHVFGCADDEGNSVDVIYTEGDLIYSRIINVSYVYDPAQFNYNQVKSYSGELSALNEKLNGKKDVKMVVFGDSISEGCSSSGHWNREPRIPFYGDLVKSELESKYGSKITMTNMSLGGKTSAWGAGVDTTNNGGDNIKRLKSLAPDFLIIGFGANDAGSVSVEDFASNIQTIANAAREANPDCSIVFLSTAAFNPYFVKRNKQVALRNIYKETSYLYDNASFVDMYDLTVSMFEKKETYELLANNLNHPNDFIHRVYAMNILSAITDYKAINK